MAVTALQLVAKVTADTSDVSSKLKQVRQDADNAKGDSSGGISGLIERIGGMAAVAGAAGAVVGGLVFLKDQIADSIQAATQYQQVQAQTVAVLKSTGDASHESAEDVQALAENFSKVTPYSRDATQAAENMLLTFTGIGSTVFPQATEATLNMATALHTDATNAALQLGKALNDPATGMQMLHREGVTFTKQQIEQAKAMEKAGNLAGAQAIVLKELQKEFGGSAQAAGSTFAGSLQILQNQLEDTKEKVGAALIPVLSQLLTAIAPVLSAVAGFVANGLGVLATFITGTVVPVVQTQLMPIISKLAELLTGKGTPAFRDVVEYVQANVLPTVHEMADFFVARVLPVIEQLAQWILTKAVPALVNLEMWFAQHILPIIKAVAGIIVTNVVPALENIAQSIRDNVVPHVQLLLGSLGRLWDKISPIIIPVLQLLGWILQNVVGPALSLVFGIIGDGLGVVSWLIDRLGNLLDLLGKVKEGIGNALGGAGNLLSHIPGFAEGTDNAPAGLAIVGEHGPEVVAMRGGERVIPLGGSSPLATGASAAAGFGGGSQMVQVTTQINLDGYRVAQVVTKHQPKVIRNATGQRGI